MRTVKANEFGLPVEAIDDQHPRLFNGHEWLVFETYDEYYEYLRQAFPEAEQPIEVGDPADFTDDPGKV